MTLLVRIPGQQVQTGTVPGKPGIYCYENKYMGMVVLCSQKYRKKDTSFRKKHL